MLIEKQMESWEKESAIPKLFLKMNSLNFAEKFTTKTTMGNFVPVGEAGDYPRTDVQEGYSQVIEPETWKNSFAITKEMVEDKKSVAMKGEAIGFTDSYNRTREELAGNFIANGINTTYKLNGRTFDTTTADGKALFAQDHTSITGKYANQSNIYSDAFSADALSAAECAMQDYRNDNGNKLAIQPDTIIIPNNWELKKAVFAAIGSDKDPNTANNGFNYQFGRWTVIVWHYLGTITGADKPWILLDSKYNETYAGLIWIERVPLSVNSWIDNSNDNNVWNGRARFGLGFSDWRQICLGGVSGKTAQISA
jgi:hypothetical protein